METNPNKEPLVLGGQGRSADAVVAAGVTAGVCFVLMLILGGVVCLAS